MNRAVSLNSCILFYFLVLRGIQCRYWLFLQCVRSVNASSHWVHLFSDEGQISLTEASREWANEANVQKTARGAKTVAAGIKYVVLWEAWGFKDFRDMCFMSVLWKLAAPGQVKKTEKKARNERLTLLWYHGCRRRVFPCSRRSEARWA